MKTRWNGSKQSSNTPSYDQPGLQREDFALYRCMVVRVLYVDNPLNISKNSKNPEVLYDCLILGGYASGQKISNCRLAKYLAKGERTLTPTSKDYSKVRLSENDGDIVYVQFNQGHDGYPVITAIAQSFNDLTGAKQSEGPRLLETFNGLTKNINNKGELITTMKSGETKEGRFTPGNSEIIKEEWLKDEKVVRTYKSGLKVTEDGANDKVEVLTKGGTTTVIDGKGNTISIKAGSTEVLIDGASGKISLKGDMVDLGTSVSDFVTMFTALSSAFATHFHMVPQAPAGTLPSAPPAAPLLTSVGSQTVKVQP